MAELTYREILPQRSVDDNSFSRGVQNFIWSLGHPTSCILSKSYFRFQIEVNSDRAGGVPQLRDLVAPADNAIACLYNNVQFYAGGRQVSQIINGCPQASQCKARLMSSSAWLETLGADAKLLEGFGSLMAANEVVSHCELLIASGDVASIGGKKYEATGKANFEFYIRSLKSEY